MLLSTHSVKSLGPWDILLVLLTNLCIQECQSLVCSMVSITIVAETCGCKFFTLLSQQSKLIVIFWHLPVSLQFSTSTRQPN